MTLLPMVFVGRISEGRQAKVYGTSTSQVYQHQVSHDMADGCPLFYSPLASTVELAGWGCILGERYEPRRRSAERTCGQVS